MKKFIYQMENVLQIKIKLEEQAKIAYGNARLKLNKEEEKLKHLRDKKVTFEDEMRQLRQTKLNLPDINQCDKAIEITKVQIEEQIIAVKNAEQKLEIARKQLNDAMVERKIHEKLKEKAFEDYMLEFDAEERKEIDELNSFTYSNPAVNMEDK